MIEAVLFDWGGTLTPWHAIDFAAEAQALALAAIGGGESAAELLPDWGDTRGHADASAGRAGDPAS